MKKIISLVVLVLITGAAVFSQVEQPYRATDATKIVNTQDALNKALAAADPLNSVNCGYDSCLYYGAVRWKEYHYDAYGQISAYFQRDEKDSKKINLYYLSGEYMGSIKKAANGYWQQVEE